jgi:hypothetical protein
VLGAQQKGNRMVKSLWLVVTTMAMLAMSAIAHAWGAEGHQVIALMSQSQLTPAAKAEINRLLALEPGETLVSISTWADEHRNRTTGSWHYVNFPRDTCTYDAQRDCPDGQCVVGAIQNQLGILGSNAADEKRLNALKYIVHFVGDIHQPLHAGYQDDKGGNKYQVQAFGKGSNLHALWDGGLIKHLNEDTEVLAARLTKLPMKGKPAAVVQFAEESCRLVGQPGFYPEHTIDSKYIQKVTPLMEQQLKAAGDRLAALLNQVLR